MSIAIAAFCALHCVFKQCRSFPALCHNPSSRVLFHLQHCGSLTEWWIVKGSKQSCKYTCRLTCIHVPVRYWSLMIEAFSEQSALNIYCSISRALCGCVNGLFPLSDYIYMQHFCTPAACPHVLLLCPKEPLNVWKFSNGNCINPHANTSHSYFVKSTPF